MSIGLDSFDTTALAGEGAVMEVRSPGNGAVMYWKDAEGNDIRPWTITLYGADSERVTKVRLQQQNKNTVETSKTGLPTSTEVNVQHNTELMAVATKEWDIPLSNGQPAVNDPKEYRAAYTKYKWLYEQVYEFSGLRANFLKSALKS